MAEVKIISEKGDKAVKKIVIMIVIIFGFSLTGYAQKNEHAREPGDNAGSRNLDRDKGNEGGGGSAGDREPAAGNRAEREPAGVAAKVIVEAIKVVVFEANPIAAAIKAGLTPTKTATDEQEQAGLREAQQKAQRDAENARAENERRAREQRIDQMRETRGNRY